MCSHRDVKSVTEFERATREIFIADRSVKSKIESVVLEIFETDPRKGRF